MRPATRVKCALDKDQNGESVRYPARSFRCKPWLHAGLAEAWLRPDLNDHRHHLPHWRHHLASHPIHPAVILGLITNWWVSNSRVHSYLELRHDLIALSSSAAHAMWPHSPFS